MLHLIICVNCKSTNNSNKKDMKILHITDFHFAEKGKDPSKIIEEICKKINDDNEQVDFVFFTGDLVNIGGDNAPYQKAKELLFDKLTSSIKVKQANIIICPGNHDIDRSKISKALKSYIDDEIRMSNDKLNAFYRNNKNVDFINSINPSVSFYNFIAAFHENNEDNIISQLYTIHYRSIENKKIGIACLNSAWLSAVYQDEDKGKLLIPTELLNEIKHLIINCDQKIILIHHPLYFLQDFNLYDVEHFIHSEFNLMFSGHVHKISSLSRYNGTNGIFEHVSKASLSHKESIGCSLVEVDNIEENKINVREITYLEDSNECHISENIAYTIPCGIKKAEVLSFRKKIYDKIANEKANANSLLLLKNDEDENENEFLSLYNHPVLKKESNSNLESKNTPTVSFEELVTSENNHLILGKDKCGKTTLLKRIQIEHLINFSRNNRIPFYIDAKMYEAKVDDKFSIENLIRSYYDSNRGKVLEMLSSSNFVLLVDNYTPNSGFSEYINNFIKTYPNIKFIICAEQNLSRTVDMIVLGDAIYEKLFFHELRRQEVISYTEKRLSLNSKTEEIQQKIIQLCKQLELPLNYWTISLLLLIHTKSSDSYAKNLFSILDICIDEIFDKKQLLLSQNKISHEQIKKICAELSKYLFEKHASNVYSATETEILSCIENTIKDNDRIAVAKEKILDYLKSCGIIKQKYEDSRLVFRLNGFFEYFLAYQMTKDEDFRQEVLCDEKKFIAFKNQIEIYSGFKRDDYQFLKIVYERVHEKLNCIFSKYDHDKDKELLNKIKTKNEVEQFCREISVKRTLSSLEKAKIEDTTSELEFNSEVHLIKDININDINSELLERYLSILARTFRSIDDVTGHKSDIDNMFKYIIDSYCDLGFYLVEEFERFAKQEFESEKEIDLHDFPELELLSFISSFTPLICQVWLFDGVGHYNLERKIRTEIETILRSEPISEYRLFILCFLLLDIDLVGNKDCIEIAMKHIKIPVLKYAIVIKLNYYLAFKGGKDKQFQQSLSNNIQEARLNLDNKTDISDIHKQIQQKKKESIARVGNN